MRASAGDEHNFVVVGSTKERYPVLIGERVILNRVIDFT
jgi:hypothetical protein